MIVRCVVCGRLPDQPCCTDCHRSHDHAWQQILDNPAGTNTKPLAKRILNP